MEWNVLSEEAGNRLQNFLKSKLGDSFSSRQIKQMIEHGQCLINHKRERFASTKLGCGDRISLDVGVANYPSMAFEAKRVLFEDHDLLAYDKPPSVASDYSKFIDAVKRDLPFLALVHRLDKDTSGVLIFAKNPSMEKHMVGLFKNRLVEKVYLAVVDGHLQKSHGTIENFLAEKRRYEGHTIWGSVKNKGLLAITKWECRSKGHQCALLRCYPKTGRTHQIRVHLSELGHPLIGDYEYGKHFACPYTTPRCLLHALEVSLTHPVTGKRIKITAPLPLDFQAALKQLNLFD